VTQPTLTVQQIAALPRVNLLPGEVHEKRKARQVKILLGCAVVGSVAAVGLLYFSAHHAVTSAQSDLATAQTQHTALQAKVVRFNGDTQLRSQRDAESAMLSTAMAPEIQWSRYLNDLTLRIPDNVWLTSISATESMGGATGSPAVSATSSSAVLTPGGVGSIQFQGIAFSHDDVAAWLNSVAQERGYSNAYFSTDMEITRGPRIVDSFTSSVDLTPKALSGRYNHPAGG